MKTVGFSGGLEVSVLQEKRIRNQHPLVLIGVYGVGTVARMTLVEAQHLMGLLASAVSAAKED